jgi:Ni,Fe-hydrogenase III small subunit
MGIYPPSGRMVAIEVKRPGCKPTPEQVAFLAAIRKNGGIAIVCDDEKNLERLLTEAAGCNNL